MGMSRRANAYRQRHPPGSPPAKHAAPIACYVNVFRSLWGLGSMGGWLVALGELGFLERAGDGFGLLGPTVDRDLDGEGLDREGW